MVEYRVFVDKDGDGYCSIWSELTDADNIVESPLVFDVTVSGVGLKTFSTGGNDWFATNDLTERFYEQFTVRLYGANVGSGGQLYLGWDGTNYAGIFLDGPLYVVSFWARHDYSSGQSYAVALVNQFGVVVGTSSVVLTSTLTRVHASFTDINDFGPGNHSVRISGGAVSTAIYVGGLMVASGQTPGPFNTGAGWEDDDISNDVMSIHWFRGMREAYDPVFSPGDGEMVLDNLSGNYWPGTATWLVPGRRVFVAADDSGSWVILARLQILKVRAERSDYENRQLRVLLTDEGAGVGNAVVQHDLMVSVDFDTWVTNFSGSGLAGPYGQHTWNFDYRGPKSAAGSGEVVLGYLGDQWDDGINALVAMDRLAFVTRCRAWFDRLGRLWIWEYPATDDTADATITAFEDVGYSFGEHVVNFVRCNVTWRVATAANTIVWNSTSGAYLSQGGVRWFDPSAQKSWVVRLRDEEDRPMALATLNAAAVQPSAGGATWPTYNAYFNSLATFAGTNRGSNFTVTYENHGSSVLISVTNNSASVGAYGYFQIGGVGLKLGELETIWARDDDSIDAYGVSRQDFREWAFFDEATAQDFCDYIIAKRKDPVEFARYIGLSDQVGFTHILNRDLFDLVTIQESGHSGLDLLHAIISEEHWINLRGKFEHKCVFGLEKWEYTS